MANNPLDELVQTTSNPVTDQPAMTDVPSVSTSPLPATPSKLSEFASEIPSTSSPDTPVEDPLDQLISGAANQNPIAEAQVKSTLTPNSPIPPSPLSQTEPRLNDSAVQDVPSTPAPLQANPSSASISNPLDSLISHNASHKPIESHSALDQLEESASEEKNTSSLSDVPAMPGPPMSPSAIQNSPRIVENPISADAANTPAPIPNIPEHDIAPMSPPVSSSNLPITSVAPPIAIASSAIKPAAVATMRADQAPTLSKKELEEKAKKLLQDSPPKEKNSKKPWILGLLTLFIVVGAAGGGLLGYGLLKKDSTDNRSKAGFVGQGACISPKGITIPQGQSTPNQSGLFNYRPASSNVSDATKYYDVSKNEGVSFSVQVTNTTATAITDQYHFFAQKVKESPRGIPVTAQSPLDEATLEINHRNNGDVQETVFNSGNMNFNLGPNETKTLTGLWTPNNVECGLYQIDLGVMDFENASCSQDLVAGAGFVRVVGCETACNTTCSSNERCTSINSAYVCSRDQDASDWSETTSNYATAGSGAISCFNSSNNSSKAQHLVRAGRIWTRSFANNTWSNWTDVTVNVSSAGTGEISSFSSFIGQDGHTQQHVVRGGKIWYRKVEGNAWQTPWTDVTSNVNETGAGSITGFNVYLKDGLYEAQFLVKGGKVYRRDNRDGWSAWEEVTTQFSQISQGDITCLSGVSEANNELQYFVRGAKVYAYNQDWFEGYCRLATNPTSQTCAPPPTPEVLACTSLSKAPLAPKLGDVVTFTCAAAPAPVAKYEFRYMVANGTYVPLTPETANPNTAKLTVTSSGAHKVECRACEDAAATTCTTWGIAR